MGQLYGAAVWDPLLIIAQIVSVQCLFYLGLGLWQAIFIAPYTGTRLTITHIFDWHALNFAHYAGYMTMASTLANAPVTAVWLLWVVERSKKCLDFGCTCYFFHFIGCWVYSRSLPASLWWWGCNVMAMTAAVLLGEWLCARREMADIPIGGTGRGVGSRAPESMQPSAGAGTSSVTGTSSATANAVTRLGVSSRSGTGGGGAGMRQLSNASNSGGGSRGGIGITRMGNISGKQAGAVQMSTLSMSGAAGSRDDGDMPVLSRTNSKSRLLGGDEEV